MSENLSHGGEWETISIRIPPELKGYAPSLKRFFDAMIFKLRRNAHKGKWEAVPLARAMTALRDEADELEEAVRNGNISEITLEGADCANQALIVTEIALEVRNAG